MGDPGVGEDGWHLVYGHQATDIREEQQIEEWERAKGHWSGTGKHVLNWGDHKNIRVLDRELGAGAYGSVERITFKAVTMARKVVMPQRRITMADLHKEATAMERLVHKHILKLIGTYTRGKRELYLLLYPVAVCDLSRFLEDVDDLRTGAFGDHQDALKRIQKLGLKGVGSVEDLTNCSNPTQALESRSTTALGFLQQILGCITEALAYVHEKDIRHQDMKPKNILLSPGRVYLADFGIARDVRHSEDSVTSHRHGSPFWMAPEVHDELDHRMSPADIWSLGAIFLNIVTLIYGESLAQYDNIMKQHNWPKKYEELEKFLDHLSTKATARGLEHPDAPSFGGKHLIKLIEWMLKYEPAARPSAKQVNAKLSELGGLDQIYHLSCCHKQNLYMSEILNNKLKSVHDANAASVQRILKLEAENSKLRERLEDLESSHNTYEQRIENERKHAGALYKVLKEKHDREVELRKTLEQKVKILETQPSRRPNSQNRGRGRGNGRNQALTHVNTNGPLSIVASAQQIPIRQTPESPIRAAWRRTSNIPLPIRPSTPIRPACNRDPGSASSTLISSSYSSFSRASLPTNLSFSSMESVATPGSPTTVKPVESPISDTLDGKQDQLKHAAGDESGTVKERRMPRPGFKPPVYGPKGSTSWAEMVARSTKT